MADKEYIERDAAIKAILSNPPDAHYPSWYAADVENVPTADVEEVRHGVWERSKDEDFCYGSIFCSLCGWNIDEEEYLNYWSRFNYCPNCGADMRKGDA